MTDDNLDHVTKALQELASELKFLPLELYSGATPEELRNRLQTLIDKLITEIIFLRPANKTKLQVLDKFRSTLEAIGHVDSEEKEQICIYLERIIDILGIESSDGLLNNLVYGFDVESLLQSRASEA